jgi:hypothetical protein
VEPPKNWASSRPVPMGGIRYDDAKNPAVKEINRAVVKCARDLVFSIKANDGIARLVKNHRDYALQAYKVEGDDGVSKIVGMRVAKRK